MQVSSITAVTNPFLARRNREQQPIQQAQPQMQPKQQPSSDVFVKTEDGQYVDKELDAKTGQVNIKLTKYNWSDEGVLDSTEVTRIPVTNPAIQVKTVNDFEHNAVSKGVSYDVQPGLPVHQALVTERKDPVTGKTVARETYKMSDVPGIYNVEEVDALGRKKTISSAIKTKDGGIYISKNMTSLDGTTTTYRYSKDAKGDNIRMFNQIKDKNGNVLSTVDRTYQRVNENLAYSSVNGRHYTIEQKGKNTIVTDEFEGTKTVLNEKTFAIPFYKKPAFSVLGKLMNFNPEQTKEPVISDLLKTLPGDTLIDMSKDVKHIVPLKNTLDSAFMGYFGVLNCTTDGFAVNHELGHSKDAYLMKEVKEYQKEAKDAISKGEQPKEMLKNPIADNPEFRKEYMMEKAAFVKAFPSFKEEYIDYFIFGVEGQNDRGRKETVAETNAMNSQTPVPLEVLAMRTQVLQNYFPRTIAVATKLTTPIAIAEKGVSFN